MSSSTGRRYCTFFLGNELYGIDILTVREVKRRICVTPAWGAPPAVRGLVNLRGRIVTVIDPAVQLGYEPREISGGTRLIVLRSNAELPDESLHTSADLVGLCVDRVSDVIEAEDAQLDRAALTNDRLIRGLVQCDGGVVRIVDAEQLLLPGGRRV